LGPIARLLPRQQGPTRRSTAGFTPPTNPHPLILLNLLLSCLASIQAPVIMMSQQRQAARDRLQAESDYQVNVKGEILLEHLTKEVEEIKRRLPAGGENTRHS
jgi:uncharacterized membrane protein